MPRTAKQIAQEMCFGWVKSNWDTYEDWLNSENGIGLWKREIADITFALKEYAAQQAVAVATEADDEAR